MELNPSRVSEIDMHFANFLKSQFGEQSLANFGWWGAPQNDDDNQSGTYALHTLSDGETIARLATGVKRFKLPDEFNWITIYERVTARGKSTWGEQARDTLALVPPAIDVAGPRAGVEKILADLPAR